MSGALAVIYVSFLVVFGSNAIIFGLIAKGKLFESRYFDRTPSDQFKLGVLVTALTVIFWAVALLYPLSLAEIRIVVGQELEGPFGIIVLVILLIAIWFSVATAVKTKDA